MFPAHQSFVFSQLQRSKETKENSDDFTPQANDSLDCIVYDQDFESVYEGGTDDMQFGQGT